MNFLTTGETMRRGTILLGAFMLLLASWAFGAETARWVKVVNEDATASTYTFKYDVDNNGDDAGETRGYKKITVCNNDTTDVLYADANSDNAATPAQNDAVNDGSRSTSVPIFPSSCYVFRLLSTRTTISLICTAGQTCSNAAIYAGEPL